ncbi:MAG: FkbM family methyltransferase [Candidatus Hodarchaeota archaeon]
MNNIELLKSLNENIILFKGTRIQKLKKIPKKILFSKILELITHGIKNTFKVKAETFWNDNILVIIPEKVSLSIYRYGFFEEGLTKMILQYLKPGMTFFDIGAHFGYFTLLSSLLVGSEGQVHSFEPSPITFNILKQNASNKDNVFLSNWAVFSEKKIVLLNDYGIKYSAFNSIYKARLPQDILSKLNPKQYEVESISIDEYVDHKCVKPNFIKIDAESSEYEILQGMEKTINKFHPMISIEVGDVEVKEVPTSMELINFLINKNYKPFKFKDGKISYYAVKNEQYQSDNMLFLPD